MALYNALVASLFTLFLYEPLFNITGGFPPTDMLPTWGIGLLIPLIVLGTVQAKNHFAVSKLSTSLFFFFAIDWAVWVLLGFPFNLPSTRPLDMMAEAFNVSTKLLLPMAYVAGLRALTTLLTTFFYGVFLTLFVDRAPSSSAYRTHCFVRPTFPSGRL